MDQKDSFKQFYERLKFVKFKDILAFFPMILGLVAAQPFKLFHKNIWLICERKNEARDNGYWFFKYMCENHPEIESVYAIGKKSNEYQKVAALGKVINFGSLKHWIYYFAAKKNISSQKEGKPNAAVCYILEVYLGLRKNRVYLKHGIIKDSQRWIYNDVSKLTLLCCAAERERDFIADNFGYTENQVVLTGLCRFDNLISPSTVKKQILVLPTMREWLREITSDTLLFEQSKDFCNSEYYTKWKSFLANLKLEQLLEEFDYQLVFYLHPSMQKYAGIFEANSKRVIIAHAEDYDMQGLLMESAMLITDYSSIYFDFAYLLKPIVYYHFDYEKYRKGNYQKGYFSYKDDGFGPVVTEEKDLICEIEKLFRDGMKNPETYSQRSKNFFKYRDNKNCERTYNEIIKMEKA